MSDVVPIAVIGAGGHATSVADTVLALSGFRLAAFLDEPRGEGERRLGVPVVPVPGSRQELIDLGVQAVALGLGNNYHRAHWMETLDAWGVPAPPVVHPSAHVGSCVSIGEGTVVFPGALITVSASIGRGCVINTGSIVEHDTTVGDFAQISPGASVASEVTIGAYVFLGIGSAVKGRVSIGERTVVGGGAMVIDDLPPGVLAVGVPARRVRDLEPDWSPV